MLYVECKADFALVSSVANIPKRDIIHELNKSEICKFLTRRANCIGMVDEDPDSIQPACFGQMKLAQEMTNLGIKVFSQESKGNRIIVLCPNLESWLIRASRQSRIDLQTFGLPDEPNRLHQVINYRLDNVGRLVVALLESGNEAVATLRNLLKAA